MTTINQDDTSFDGSRDDDHILVLANGAVVNGRGGDDWITTSYIPSDVRDVSTDLRGDQGNDHIHAVLGLLDEEPSDWDVTWTTRATLEGGLGNDALSVEFRSYFTRQLATVDGGEGDDLISISSEALNRDGPELGRYIEAEAYGGDGHDRILISLIANGLGGFEDPGLNAHAHGDDGDDFIHSYLSSGIGATENWLYGGAGDDTIVGVASSGGDLGGAAFNRALGGEGNDNIRVTADSIDFPAWNEVLGGDGNDTIRAEADSGYYEANSASNDIDGGAGDDRITAKIAIRGPSGEDTEVVNILRGGDGADRLAATITAEDMSRGDFHSDLYGGAGNDRLSVKGGDGNRLEGNQGDDVLLGGAGSDRLIGGQGDDYLRGRGGDDFFVFGSIRAGERDRIVDFVIGEDVIDVSAIDARSSRGGNQAFTFDASGEGGAGKLWVEDNHRGSGSLVYADTGKALLVVALLDGADIHASDYTASDFIL